jgi:hypothetical protein
LFLPDDCYSKYDTNHHEKVINEAFLKHPALYTKAVN